MKPAYRLVLGRIQGELPKLELSVRQAREAFELAGREPSYRPYFLGAAALALASFYNGLEAVLRVIAENVDEYHPSGERWHRELLAQVSHTVPSRRPPVLSPETVRRLEGYLDLRHKVRAMYVFDIDAERLRPHVEQASEVLEAVRRDLEAFAAFLRQAAGIREETGGAA